MGPRVVSSVWSQCRERWGNDGVDRICLFAQVQPASLAFALVPPSNVRIITVGLGYDTELRWSPNHEKDLGGYYIRYRETTSPVWQYTVFTTDTSMTIGVIKDDYLFGVQAVGKDGNASLASVPMPQGR